MNERREGIRVALDVTVSEKLVAGSAKAKAINLSNVGMRYTKPGTTPGHGAKEVFLEFTLAGEAEPIRVMGWVVEEIKKGNGLETAVTFMFLQESDEKKINTYVKKQLSA
jgi:hypothetical protein